MYNDFDMISAASGGAWALLWLNARASHDDGGLDSALANDNTSALRKLDSVSFVGRIWTGWTAFWAFVFGNIGAHSSLYGVVSTKFGAPFLRDTTPDELDENVRIRKHPVPVFTTTETYRCHEYTDGRPPRDLGDVPIAERLEFFRPLREHVVEFTPYGWGNGRFWQRYENIDQGTAEGWATISGAAPDHPFARECNALRALGASFGQNIKINGKLSWLTDGGFADNIATYPLVRRSCSEIVVLDAEHDPTLEFEAYQRLQYDLKKSDDVELTVKAIDQWLLKRRHADYKIGRDFVADDPNNEIVKQPAMEGTIKSSGKVMTLIYLKLTLNPSDATFYRYRPEVQQLYKKAKATVSVRKLVGDEEVDRTCERGKDTECSFPHTPTFNTDYTAEEFRTHRLLGSDLTRLHLLPMLKQAPEGLSKEGKH